MSVELSFYALPILSADTRVRSFREQFYQLRHRVFVELKGWEQRTDRDDWDPYADSLVGVSNGEVVKGCRLIDRAVTGRLPIEECLPQDYPINPRGIEISRLASQGSMTRGFYGTLLEYLLEQGHVTVYMTIHERLLDFFASSGPDVYERLPIGPHGPKEKRNREGGIDKFFPAALSLEGMKRVVRFLERVEAM